MRELIISKDLKLPADLATQTIAIVARKRVGKTYTASVIAEELIETKIPIVVLDPTGAWWGLRSSADGKSDGYPVVIIGGKHGDVPLESGAGNIIADLVVDHPGYYVIDFSTMESDGEMERFALNFAKQLYARKSTKTFPMTLIIDEADCFCPQQPFPEQTRMLHAYDVMVRRGGIRGIGVIMITQRPAVLNKNVLTQCETLIALQISGTQDVDAVENWTKRHGTKEEREIMLNSLAGLQMAEAYFWSPSWMRVFKKIHVRQRYTFNSSATPKVGEKQIVPQKIAAIDLAKLGDRIKATLEKSKENDPEELKKQLADARKELVKLRIQPFEASPKADPILTPSNERALLKLGDQIEKAGVLQKQQGEILTERYGHLITINAAVRAMTQKTISPPPLPVATPILRNNPIVQKPIEVFRKREPAQADGEVKLGRCASAILSVCCSFPHGKNKGQVALLSGYSVNSSTFSNALTELSQAGAIWRTGDQIGPTPGAEKLIRDFQPLPTGDALRTHWLSKLGGAPNHMLRFLISVYPEFVTREQIGERTNYSATSSTFSNGLTALRAPELIEENAQKMIRAASTLFDQ